jgi:hypothetical protein
MKVTFEEFVNETTYPITRIINQVRKEFTEENTCTIEEINNGLCIEFEEEVIDRMGGYSDDLYELSSDMFYSSFMEDVESWGEVIPTIYDGCWSKQALDYYGYPLIPVEKLHIGHHAWIYYKGKHYDSESPYGVKTPWELNFFKRQIIKYENI